MYLIRLVGSEGRIIAWHYCLAFAMRPLTKVRPYLRPISKPQPLQSLAHVMIQLGHFGLHRVNSTFLILLRRESGLKGRKKDLMDQSAGEK